MANLPQLSQIQSDDQSLNRLQSEWRSKLNPILAFPPVSGQLISKVALTSGSNIIRHGLGRPLQGWIMTRMRSAAVQVYDTQDSNPAPSTTLQLTSTGASTVDLWVF